MPVNNEVSGIANERIDGKESPVDLDAATLKKILDNSYDEIFVLDGNGRVIYVNNACERHYGMKVSEVIGKTITELIGLGYWHPPVTPIVHREKRRVTIEQTTYLGKKLITTVTPVFDEKGEIELTVHNARDLTQLEAVKYELEMTRHSLVNYRKKSKTDNPKRAFGEIICHSKKMKELVEFAEQIACVDSTVLILGESGTGKGLFARHIHKNSRRKDGPFLALNCAAIPEDLLESELFGYSNGAFTGAERGGKKGLIELANGGTLFLDEIAELSPRLQAKILQVIQERQFIPVGGTEVKKADVRIISATNQDLPDMVEKGSFRKDLYYRLNVIEINIPPLRERPEDIIPLVYFYIEKFNKKYNVCRDVSKECLETLCRYSWPGNVRELENLIERLVVSVRDNEIKTEHLPKLFQQEFKTERRTGNLTVDNNTFSFPPNVPFDVIMREVEKELITRAYREYGSSRKVAKALKISQTKASRLIRKYCKNMEVAL
ncbi:MAG TPA: sigma 54-interacting transcriptional regulator [Syntrophomonadaceae bacterium]|nr:sigma 54-interacting transcriptional regulator [Syntrophomonadaceae bacterium]